VKPTWIIGIILVFIFIVALGTLWYLGFLRIPGLNLQPGDPDAPPGAQYCGYTEMQILDMLEVVAGKDLNNEIGVSFVRALNMQACGSNDESVANIVSHYMTQNSDWYLIYDNSQTGSGWTARTVVWSNAPDVNDATLIKSVMVGSGITVESAYGYDTITVTGDGTMVAYQGFILWVASS